MKDENHQTISTDQKPITSYLRSADVAKLVGVHPKTIERKARRGQLPGHFKLNHWYFIPSEIAEWMSQ